MSRNTLFSNMEITLKKSPIDTWFDMGIFLDQIRDKRKFPEDLPVSFKKFKNRLKKGVAFLTFDFGIDGVSVEVSKYTDAIESIIGLDPKNKSYPIHWIAGDFKEGYQSFINDRCKRFVLKGAAGFDEWDGYQEYFHTKLERGSLQYNALATKIWSQTKDLSLRLGRYLVDNDIQLLFSVNVSSNPGNVSLAFALVIVSEFLKIPVINSNHDFYWESGARPWTRKSGDTPGVRDHFFCNADIGEIFSLIECLYPWDSPYWFQANINIMQSTRLTDELGFNPLAVHEIPTTVNLKKYKPVEETKQKKLLESLGLILSGGSKPMQSEDARKYCKVTSDWINLKSPIFLGNEDGIEHDLTHDNLLFLQPTRIIKRKRIERNFQMIEALLGYSKFREYFLAHSKLKITLHITGPATLAHQHYFEEIVVDYVAMLDRLPHEFKLRVFLSFTFGRDSVTGSEQRVQIHDLFAISDLVLLPSKTEGRGLPIIESSAVSVPILVSRYHPEKVFSEVIGEHLDATKRINIFEFPTGEFDHELLDRLFQYCTNPAYYYEELLHNREVIKKRYTRTALVKKIELFLNVIWQRSRLDKDSLSRVKKAFSIYKKATCFDDRFKQLVVSNHRKYLPGYGLMEYMIYLKSLIDPSFFRVEEKEVKGRTIIFARRMIRKFNKSYLFTNEDRIKYFKDLDNLFSYFTHNQSFAVDHSMSYRHRNRRHYPYRQLTEHELYGVVAILYRMVAGEHFTPIVRAHAIRASKEINASISTLLGNQDPVIDDRDRLAQDLRSQKPIALFIGKNCSFELRIFALLTLRIRLGIKPDGELTADTLEAKMPDKIGAVTLFVREKIVDSSATYDSIIVWLKKTAPVELGSLYKAGFLRVVKTSSLCVGAHLAQLGKQAAAELLTIKNNGGFVIACEDYNMATFDMIDIASYRIGQSKTQLSACFMGINPGDSYVLWVPPGLRPCLSYPTPVQTPLEFHRVLTGALFRECVDKYGEAKVLENLSSDADEFGNPVATVLKGMLEADVSDENNVNASVKSSQINGLYEDDAPWSGAMTQIETGKMDFEIVFSGKKAQSVMSFAAGIEEKTGKNVMVAWNGGYILNPELVGKLGLSADYIGSPLGLVISNSDILSAPLYNKPAILFYQDGSVSIQQVRVNTRIEISVGKGSSIKFESAGRKSSENTPLFYDLISDREYIPAQGRIILRLAGRKIIERISGQNQIRILPVGLTLSIPEQSDHSDWKRGEQVTFNLPQFDQVCNAVEAGPLLVKAGKLCIDMETEGWKTRNSITTQAARVDFTDLRGPKIGVGLSQKGQLIVIAVNGRIRESVGATHVDLGKILIEKGAVDAMGFDPGGSVTLIVGKHQLNISPYNKAYESSPYSLPPEPRFVGSAVLGTLKKLTA